MKSQELQVKIIHLLYPISKEILHQIFSPYGILERIEMMQPSMGFQEARVYFCSIVSAKTAMFSLQDRCIYDGCCRLQIQFDSQEKNMAEYVDSLTGTICQQLEAFNIQLNEILVQQEMRLKKIDEQWKKSEEERNQKMQQIKEKFKEKSQIPDFKSKEIQGLQAFEKISEMKSEFLPLKDNSKATGISEVGLKTELLGRTDIFELKSMAKNEVDFVADECKNDNKNWPEVSTGVQCFVVRDDLADLAFDDNKDSASIHTVNQNVLEVDGDQALFPFDRGKERNLFTTMRKNNFSSSKVPDFYHSWGQEYTQGGGIVTYSDYSG